MSTVNALERPQTRRRAWSLLGIVTLIIAIYLALWMAYAAQGLVDYGRYRQLPPGASGQHNGMEYRVLSLTRAPVLKGRSAGTDASAPAKAVWVVAVIEATHRDRSEKLICSVDLIGPDRRTWETATSPVSRDLNPYCDDEVGLGVPQQFEAIFLVPQEFADQLYGIVLRNYADSTPSQILRP